MKRKDVILFIGIIVASIIGTKTFANERTDLNLNQIADREVISLF